jgi:hypothetical protein
VLLGQRAHQVAVHQGPTAVPRCAVGTNGGQIIHATASESYRA